MMDDERRTTFLDDFYRFAKSYQLVGALVDYFDLLRQNGSKYSSCHNHNIQHKEGHHVRAETVALFNYKNTKLSHIQLLFATSEIGISAAQRPILEPAFDEGHRQIKQNFV